MTDSYILVQCDRANVAPLRKAMIAAQTPTKHVSHMVISTTVNSQHLFVVGQVFDEVMSKSKQHMQDWKDGKLVQVAQCATCDRCATSRARKPGSLIHFLKRLGWAMRTESPADLLVCNRCATPQDSPISIFDPRWRSARRQTGIVRMEA